MAKTLLFAVMMLVLTAAPGWGKTMKSIGKEKVNVRSGPGLKHDVLFQVHLGYPLVVKKRKGDWVQCADWLGNTGWVHRPLLADVPTVVVVKENVKVRRGPGLRHRVVTGVDKGEVYKIFQRRKNWLRIGYYREGREIGWVRHDLVWGE